MLHAEMSCNSLRALLGSTLLVASGFATSPASAEDLAQQPAIKGHADDSTLKWGPCPDFLPAGCGVAVLRGDPAEPNADVFFKVPAGSQLPLHWHTSAERMVLVAGKLHVAYEGQTSTVLKPGTYAYGPAKLPHSGSCVSTTPCVLFIAFESSVDAVPGKAE